MSNYGFGEDQVKNSVNPFPVSACVDNVEITKAEYSCAEDNSWESIDITYTRNGTSIVDKMFKINEDKIGPRSWIDGDTAEKAVADKQRVLNTQLYHVATKVGLTKEQLQSCDVGTFKSLATDYCNLINTHCKGVKLYVKTVKERRKDGKVYVKLGRNPNNTVPYLQRMDEGDCQLEYTPKEIVNNELANNSSPGVGISKAASYMPPSKV